MHYLDNAATTAVSTPVADVINEVMRTQFGNPSSLYSLGAHTEQLVEKARQTVADSLGCTAREVYFTSCGSESNNLAIQGAVAARSAWCKKIVCTGFEHPSVYQQIERYEKAGMQVVWVVPGADGQLDLNALVDSVDSATGLVTFMHVNNEIGTILPVARLAGAVKEKNRRTAVHVDGVQGWGRLAIDLSQTQIDSYSISGHKVHAPKGIGALYVRRGHNLLPPYLGGGQERGLRPGTENIPYIAGLAKATQAFAGREKEIYAHVEGLNRYLRQGLAALPGITINSPNDAIAHVLNFSVANTRSETLLHFLEAREVYVSSGSACSKGAASHTLVAMGLPADRIDGAVRVSFTADNTNADVNALLEGLAAADTALAKRK